jgi:hypothetical protein
MLPLNSLTVFYAKFMTLLMCFTAISCEVRLCACFTLNFVLIYAVLARVLRWNLSSQNPRTIGCTRFSHRNFVPCLLLQNRYRIYDKFRSHLRCFSSRFMLESARARTRARSAARDFHAVTLGPVCCYKTDIGFKLNFELIYAVLAHVLRWNPLDPEPSHDRCTRFSRRNFGPRLLLQNGYRIYTKFCTHLCCFSSRFTRGYIYIGRR